jgi:hypothetical protein
MWGKSVKIFIEVSALVLVLFSINIRSSVMKYILFVILLIPSFVLAQTAGKDKKVDSKAEVKTAKEPTKTDAKTAKDAPKSKVNNEAVKTEVKAAKETTKSEPKPAKNATSSGVWVCGGSDVWHNNKDCSGLKNCKQTITEGQGKAERQCKICAKSNK